MCLIEQVFQVTAEYDFHREEQGELSFSRGDIITVNEHADSNWWRGTLHGRTGIFPRNHVRVPDHLSLNYKS